jgi:predicted PurR-regulated permease PerM
MELITALLIVLILICTFTMLSPILFLVTFLQGQTLRREMHQSFKDAQDRQNQQANNNYRAFRNQLSEYEQELDLLKLKYQALEREVKSIKRARDSAYSLRPTLQRTGSNRSLK